MKHKILVNEIDTNGTLFISSKKRIRYKERFETDDLEDNDLISKYNLIQFTPTVYTPVEMNYPAGSSLLLYAYFIPVPDGFTKYARLTYEDVESVYFNNLIPFQTIRIVFDGGVFTGWHVTLPGEDAGDFTTLYPSIVTIIPEGITGGGGGSGPATEVIKTFATFASITFPLTKGIIEVVSDETRENKRVYYMIPNTGAASGADLKYIAVTQTNEPE